MCVGDYRLGRLVRARFFRVLSAIPSSRVIPRDPDRVGIAWYLNDVATAYTVAIESEIGNVNIFSFPATVNKLEFFMPIHGDLPTKQFTMIDSVGGVAFTWIEWTLPDAALRSYLEEFTRGGV